MSLPSVRVHIGGMTCPLCGERVTKALAALPFVESASASFSAGYADVILKEGVRKVDVLPLLEDAVRQAGYIPCAAPTLFCRLFSFGRVLALAALFCLLLKYALPSDLAGFFPDPGSAAGMASLFVIGLLTSAHCLAMCGGIAMTQSMMAAGSTARPLFSAVLCYQGGRLLAYAAAGALAGFLGQSLALTPFMRGCVMLFAGIFMLAMALNMLGMFAFLRRLRPVRPRTADGWRRRVLAATPSAGHCRAALLIGLANGLMPCGPLQSMQIYALGTGSALDGACSMAVFCLGTMPAMLALGLAAGRLNRNCSRMILQVSAAVVMALGLGMMGSGLALTGHAVPSPAFFSPSVSLPENAAVARLADGGQEVSSLADYGEYQPIVVQRGIPVSWNLKMPEDTLVGCNNEIIAADFSIRRKLQEGDNIIRFTPEKARSYVFSCWMGMIKSSITVVDKLPE